MYVVFIFSRHKLKIFKLVFAANQTYIMDEITLILFLVKLLKFAENLLLPAKSLTSEYAYFFNFFAIFCA